MPPARSPADDLVRVLSLGFRGEALPSIASCSEVEIISRTADTNEATRLKIVGGRVDEEVPGQVRGNHGNRETAFHNTPARLKFMKQAATEKRYCAEYVTTWLWHIRHRLSSNRRQYQHAAHYQAAVICFRFRFHIRKSIGPR